MRGSAMIAVAVDWPIALTTGGMPRRRKRFPSAFAQPYDAAAPRHAMIPAVDTFAASVVPRRNKTQTPTKPRAAPEIFPRFSLSSALVKWMMTIENIGVVAMITEARPL